MTRIVFLTQAKKTKLTEIMSYRHDQLRDQTRDRKFFTAIFGFGFGFMHFLFTRN